MRKLSDLTNLSYVPRWAVVNMMKPQSVAEHSYRVACIVMAMFEELGADSMILPSGLLNDSITYALVHDAAETYSSDIPSNFKQEVGRSEINSAAERLCDWITMPSRETQALVKVADQIEGWSWWILHGDSRRTHPWITSQGPVSLNEGSMLDACRKNGDILEQFNHDQGNESAALKLAKAALSITYVITGGEIGPANKLAIEIKARQYFTRVRSHK